jgi:hypothetical protein
VVGAGRLIIGAGRLIIGAGAAGVWVTTTGGVTFASSMVKLRVSEKLLWTGALLLTLILQ